MPATLKDIARITGLSVPTVCLILNGQEHKFRAESCKAVFEAAKQLKYRPDTVMRRLSRASGRRDAIGLLTPAEDAPEYADHAAHEYFCGVNNYLLDHSQLLVAARLNPHKVDGPGAVPRMLSERFVDGLILVEGGMPAEVGRLVEHYEIMTVWLNTERRAAFDCAHPDEAHGGRIATERLLGLGHRRVVYLSAPWGTPLAGISRTYAVQERGDGYRQAMTAARLKPELIETTLAKPDSLGAFIAGLIASHRTADPITGVITGSFPLAVRVMEMLATGPIQCPRDVSLISGGDLHIFRNVWPNIVRLSCDRYQIGAAAAEMILAKVEQAGQPQPSRVFKGDLVGEATIGPVPRSRS